MNNEIQTKAITKENFHLFEAMMWGYAKILKEAGIVNISGEIAIMKHSITAFCDTGDPRELVMTWGGTCTGLQHAEKYINRKQIEPGQVIVGFWEPGYRCNGGTFFTNLLLLKWGPEPEKIRANPEAMEFANKLTIPSKIYAPTITRILGWTSAGATFPHPLAKIYGIAHITGGGIWGKFGEMLPEGVGAELTDMPEPCTLLREAQKLSWDTELRLTDRQAYGTFHGGCGMLIITSELGAAKIIREAKKDGIKAQIVGQTTKSNDREIYLKSRFKESGTILYSAKEKKFF